MIGREAVVRPANGRGLHQPGTKQINTDLECVTAIGMNIMTRARRSGAVGASHVETVGDVLSSRRTVLVGREDEVEIFRSILDRDGPALCYVHGARCTTGHR